MNSAPEIFTQANAHMRAGAPEQAVAVCLEGLNEFPEEPNLLCLTGRTMMALKRFEDARGHIEKALSLHPKSPIVQETYGDFMLLEGFLDEAIAAYKLAQQLDPKRSELKAKIERALGLIEKLKPGQGPRRQQMAFPDEMTLAAKHEQEGAPDKAEKIYRSVLRKDPNHVEAMRLLAAIAFTHKKYRDVEILLTRAVERAPHYPRVWLDLTMVQMELEKLFEAVESAETLVELTPEMGESHLTLANALGKANLAERSIASYRKALELRPEHPAAFSGLGQQLKTIGQQEEAIATHRANIKVNPTHSEPYWALANMKTFRFEEEEVAAMEALLEDPDIEDLDHVQLHNSLGLAYEQRKDYQRAFNNFHLCNQRRRKSESYDPVDTEVSTEALIEIFNPDFLRDNLGNGSTEGAPIFIVGLPRSGSTLIEQILASHSQVEGTHELTDLSRVVQAIPKRRAQRDRFPQTVTELGAQAWTKIGNQYLERTQKYRHGAPRFIDKNPNNFTFAGLIALALPNAKIIDARRAPLDSCFGSYKQLFAAGQPFSYDLTEIGEYYLLYEQVMRHWDQVLPGRVLRVDYENVVADLETQVRRILDYCELPFEEACLNFHATDRAVKTASSEQVRQPIYASSVNLWRNYEPYIDELIEVLEPLLMELPASERPSSLQSR